MLFKCIPTSWSLLRAGLIVTCIDEQIWSNSQGSETSLTGTISLKGKHKLMPVASHQLIMVNHGSWMFVLAMGNHSKAGNIPSVSHIPNFSSNPHMWYGEWHSCFRGYDVSPEFSDMSNDTRKHVAGNGCAFNRCTVSRGHREQSA